MASKKRKTLQIKRPDPNKPHSKKKALPKVKMDDESATSAIDTDELSGGGPKTAKVQQPDVNDPNQNKKNSATRIQLPDEDKIRKARRASSTQDLGKEDALPSADQIAQAEKSATMPIMIDTEDVEDGDREKLEEAGEEKPAPTDQTMEIDADSLATGDVGEELEKADQSQGSDQTMKVDADSLVTGEIDKKMEESDQSQGSDQTMQIDPDSLATGDVGEQMEKSEAGQDEDEGADHPESHEEALSAETMQMDSVDEDEVNKKKEEMKETLNAATMKMATQELDTDPEAAGSAEEDKPETDLTPEKMKESFNAMTMEMDADQITSALEEKQAESDSGSDDEDKESLDQTMDLTAQRPKTIMIKRPSKEAGSSTPTVKAVRPDAATVRTARPVTANTASAKSGTSRIDVPEGATSSKEGKTIKLRRPSGAGGHSTVSRVASGAGLRMGADGTYVAAPKAEERLSAGWLSVAILTFLVSLGALWIVASTTYPEVPMPGRIVDETNTVLPYQP